METSSALYPVLQNWKYGFINSFGDLIVEPQYDLVGRFSEGFCAVEKLSDDLRLLGYIDNRGQEVIALRPEIHSTHFSENLAQYGRDNRHIGFIDYKGDYIIEPEFEYAVDEQVSLGFSQNIAAVAKNNQWIYIDRNGNDLLGLCFKVARRFQDGYALVCNADSTTVLPKLHFINQSGQTLETIPCEINLSAQGFRNGLSLVKPKVKKTDNAINLFGFINTSGELSFKKLFAHASGFHEDVCIVREDGRKFGVINNEGEYILDPQYDDLKYLNFGTAPFKKDNLWGLINISGDIILEPTFHFIDSFIGYLPFEDPFHHMEFRDLTLAKVKANRVGSKKYRDVYINRMGEIVADYEV